MKKTLDFFHRCGNIVVEREGKTMKLTNKKKQVVMVKKISLKDFNKLQAAGYLVIITS